MTWLNFGVVRQDGAVLVQGYASKGTSRGWQVRRAASAMPSREGARAGVSSFAYQGTNSHVIVGGTCDSPARVDLRQRQWQRRRFWFQVLRLRLAASIMPARPVLAFSLQ